MKEENGRDSMTGRGQENSYGGGRWRIKRGCKKRSSAVGKGRFVEGKVVGCQLGGGGRGRGDERGRRPTLVWVNSSYSLPILLLT